MKHLAICTIAASLWAAGMAFAQPAPPNEARVRMGHWHLNSQQVEANKKIFVAMGAKMYMINNVPFMSFRSTYINLTLGNEKGDGKTDDYNFAYGGGDDKASLMFALPSRKDFTSVPARTIPHSQLSSSS